MLRGKSYSFGISYTRSQDFYSLIQSSSFWRLLQLLSFCVLCTCSYSISKSRTARLIALVLKRLRIDFKPKGLDLGAAWACPVLGVDNSVCVASDNQADPALGSLLGVSPFFFLELYASTKTNVLKCSSNTESHW